MNTIRKKDWENTISPHEAEYGAAEEGAAPGKPKMSNKRNPRFYRGVPFLLFRTDAIIKAIRAANTPA